jgi:hypothetical protein
MSFLSPTLRSAFHSNLKTSSASILRQQHYVSHLFPFRRPLPLIARPYSKDNSRTPDAQSSDPSKDPIEVPLSTNDPVTQSPKDPLTGDILPAPGSILSEYTIAPQESSELQASASDSGSGPPKREEYISSTDRKRARITKFFTYGSLLALIGGSIYLGRPLEQSEQERMGWGTVSAQISIS